MIDQLRLDLAYTGRTVLRSRSFILAVASLAVAVGLTTAVYGTADWLLNRPPGGVADPDRLVTLFQSYRERPDGGRFGLSRPQLDQLARVQDGFTEISAYSKFAGIVSTDLTSEQVVLEFVQGTYFSVLGLRPALGRAILPEDDQQGASIVAVLTHDFWQAHFGGDPNVLGRRVRVNGADAQVIGVLPREFEGYQLDWNGPSSVLLPMESGAALGAGGFLRGTTLRVIGRLLPGVSVEAIHGRLDGWLEQLPLPPEANQAFGPTFLVARPSNEVRLGYDEGGVWRFLSALLVVCSLVLLASSFNLANVVLGRAMERGREFAMRAAIGASPARLVQQVTTEAFVICVAVAGLAVLSSWFFGRLLSPLAGTYLDFSFLVTPFTTAGAIDSRIMTLAAALGGLCVVLFGMLPALVASLETPAALLRSPRVQWTWSGIRLTPRQIVLTLQVALSVTIGVVAGLYARSFANVASTETGFDAPSAVLLARVQAPRLLTGPAVDVFYQELMARVNSAPDVIAATIGTLPPFLPAGNLYSLPGDGRQIEAGSHTISSRFFETHGVPMLAGREFREPEESSNLLINRSMAEALWPGEDPIGQTVLYGRANPSPRQVIGVVASERCNAIFGDPEPCAWNLRAGAGSGYVRIRTRGDPIAFVPQLREIVRSLEPDAAVATPMTLQSHLNGLTRAERVTAGASSGLAAFALLLVALGCGSLFVSMVNASVREIAIRMALGARNRRIAGRIIAQGLALTVVGIGGGLTAARWISSGLAEQLYQVPPHDPLTYSLVSALVMAVGVGSVGYAARVATQTEPMHHLKAI